MLDATVALSRNTANTDSKELFPVETRGLVYQVGDKYLINNIDLKISAGSVTVVMGPNGAGKSLLLRLLHGLIEPSAGTVLWGGHRLSEPLRKRQAMVFQHPVLMRRSVAANIQFVLKLRGVTKTERCQELLQHVNLTAHAKQPARLLSGGEQQRLALARALALKPEVLLLDEPTASLDPASVATIETIVMAAHQRGTKIIFVTHDLGQARRLADEVVFLHDGCLLEHTSATRFFNGPISQQASDYLAGRLVF